MVSKRLAALTALAGVTLAQTSQDLAAVLNGTEGATYIAEALAEEGSAFLEAISGKSNLTFLAPNDTAITLFANSSQGEAAEAGGEDYLTNLLLYHTLNGGYNNISDYFVAHSLLTSPSYSNVTGGALVEGYYDDDENITVFFSGQNVQSHSYSKPISFAQGWIYLIDSVLSVPEPFSKAALSENLNGTTFAAGLEKTGLTEQFDSLHGATYFLPVDESWELVKDAISELDDEKLAEVLKYHAVEQIVLFDDWTNGTQLTTLSGKNITLIQTPDEEWFINNAGVSDVDIAVAGGVVVLIDNVLNPFEDYAPPLNGTDGEGVPAWSVSNATATSTGAGSSGTASVTPVATGAAISSKAGALGWTTLIGAVAMLLLC